MSIPPTQSISVPHIPDMFIVPSPGISSLPASDLSTPVSIVCFYHPFQAPLYHLLQACCYHLFLVYLYHLLLACLHHLLQKCLFYQVFSSIATPGLSILNAPSVSAPPSPALSNYLLCLKSKRCKKQQVC